MRPTRSRRVRTRAGEPLNPIAALERLVALKQQGHLTDDEFAALKARLLAPD